MKLELALVKDTVAKIEIDEALVRQSNLGGHGLKIRDGLVIQTDGDGFLEHLGVRIFPSLHFVKIVMGSHGTYCTYIICTSQATSGTTTEPGTKAEM